MSCDNIPTTVEIEQAKKDVNDFNTFMTSDTDTFVDSNGVSRLTLQGAINKLGFGIADFTFTEGGTLSNRKLLVSNDPVDGFLYRYVGTGTFPITVTAGTDPTTGTDWEAFTATSAEFISNASGGSVQDFIDTNTFKTVADMKSFTNHILGSKVVWQGYYSQSDGGSNWGVVKSGAHVEDGGSIFSVDQNTYIEANLKGGSINIAKFGAKPEIGFDNYAPIQTALIYRESTGQKIKSPAGVYQYSKTLLLNTDNTLSHVGEIEGQGAEKSIWEKTTNTPADGAFPYSVDALIAVANRSGANPYTYGNNLRGITLSSTAPTPNSFGLFCEYASSWVWNDVDIRGVDVGFNTKDAWLMNLGSTRCHNVRIGFRNTLTGTSWDLSNTWVEYYTESAYDLTGLVYCNLSTVAADHDNGLGTSVGYKFKDCRGVVIDGLGHESFSGDSILCDNSVVKINGYRPTKLTANANPRKIINAINGSFVEINATDLLGLPSSNLIQVENYDATSTISWGVTKVNIANSNLPNFPSTRKSVLSSKNGSLSVGGFTVLQLRINTGTFSPLVKVDNSLIIISAIRLSGGGYYERTIPLILKSDISTSSSAPTNIGDIKNSSGSILTTLLAYIDVSTGIINVRLSGPAFDDDMRFVILA